MELLNITNWIDEDILEKKDIADLKKRGATKIYEINEEKLYKKYGEDNAIIFYRWFGSPMFLSHIYRVFITSNSKGLKFAVCTFNKENKIDWGVFYPVYQIGKQQDFTYSQKHYPKFSIAFSYEDCKKAFELFNQLP